VTTCREVAEWIGKQGEGGWWASVAAATAELATECGDGAILTKDLLEWLAEWGRDFRRRQTGLLLVTAHRVKGLEFDHIAVLDGRWDRRSHGEDRDASRRLFYVAMTRAKVGLSLMARDVVRHPMLPPAADPSIFIRQASERAPDTSSCRKLYQTMGLQQIDLSYGGRLPHRHPSLGAIQDVRIGDVIVLQERRGRWWLLDRDGHVVARLAKTYAPPSRAKFVKGHAAAVLARRREDGEPEYQHLIKRDRWEVVVAELVFEQSPAS
jgi:ATP-dependent DNA helicase RecQ